MSQHLAIDLGAENGRVVLGDVSADRIGLTEVHRFRTGMIHLEGHLRWNVYRFYEEILEGCRACAAHGHSPQSIGVDTWGVDFALLGDDGAALGLPVTYRDARTEGMIERFVERMSRERVYAKTGVQFMRLNSLYQLVALAQYEPGALQAARHLLFMPDFFHYLLSGEMKTEYTFATTSQIYNAHTRQWDREILDAAGVAPGLLQDIVPPATEFGNTTPDFRAETGLTMRVVAPGTHDTASAVAAVPAEGSDWAYISSGTWSLMGVERDAPICSDGALRCNFTNEGGVGGTIRFLKNIMGLWIVQRVRECLDTRFEYADLMAMAESAPPFGSIIDPDNERLFNVANIVQAIDDLCAATRQPAPASPGAYVRCALESLALRYRKTLDELREVLGMPINRIHIVGGGSQNRLLCQFTADATELPVLAGPVEATALGNIIGQAVALGSLASFPEGRTLVQRSTALDCYEPREPDPWRAAHERFRRFAR